MPYYREGTKCNFGPVDFTIGIKRMDGTKGSAYYVNRKVFLAPAPKFEQDIDNSSKVAGQEISEFFLPLDPSKRELWKSFATFINEGSSSAQNTTT
ncbi:hypothetical protein TWF506_004415 [Arthrobotrys conoides]|uniref:Uncharacterized protein n=1 Tax=Arthrobotrys conoides TaxID=74498 RepID=A0AAN8RTI6_9PEZI